MNKKKKLPCSSLRDSQERPTLIKRKLREKEEKFQTLQEKFKKLYENFLDIESRLKESLEKYGNLNEENESTKEKLSKAEEGNRIEKYLKNEAYAFLIAEGLLDNFLEFRERFNRTKAQDALYTLVAEADIGGLWIDL